MIIWDKGEYEPKKWVKDKIIVSFRGEKLKGEYVMIRLKDNNWLIFKR